MKTIALLDVDGTLIMDAEGNSYNNNLIESLLSHGIKECYLFTSMSLKEKSIEERQRLIEHLEKKGITVHGVICQADLAWHFKDKIKDAFRQCEEDEYGKYPNDYLTEEALGTFLNFAVIPGIGFKEASLKGTISDQDAMNLTTMVSCIRKKQKLGTTDKSCMYKAFAKSRADAEPCEVLFVDDKEVYINDVQCMHDELKPNNITLHTMQNKGEEELPKKTYDSLLPEPIKLQQLIKLLDNYLLVRQKNSDQYLHSFFGIGLGKSLSQKEDAVDALKNALKGDDNITDEHLATLRNGQLGRILRDYAKNGDANRCFNKNNIETVRDLVQHTNSRLETKSRLEK